MKSPAPTLLREEILSQHCQIRELLQDVRQLAEHVLTHGSREDELRLVAALEIVRAAIEHHNRDEEACLEPLLRSRDVWGDIHVLQMVQAHTAEHETLLAMIDEPRPRALARQIAPFAADLLQHMDAEERGFLAEDVLSYDEERPQS